MNTGSYYKIHHFFPWTRRNIYKVLLIAIVPTVLYGVCGINYIAVPWTVVALVGVAAAFIAGFRNTQTYNRIWEARQIWGAIVNDSRTWAIMVKDFVTDKAPGADSDAVKAAHQRLIYRHIAWLTALRYQLRKPQIWENQDKPYFKEYQRHYEVPEWTTELSATMAPFISKADLDLVLARANRATQLLGLQSANLKELKKQGLLEGLSYVEMENVLKEFFNSQGKCERIKNFPYPRQFASINLYFTWLLVVLIPFGLVEPLSKLGEHGVWLTIPFSVIIGWVFTSLEQIAEATENPFEGGANDIPMAALSRTIEIDLRELLGETELPPAMKPKNNILM